MKSEQVTRAVTPAKAGVQSALEILDSGLRRNDSYKGDRSFSESIKVINLLF
jgi:hypothetical protein